MGREFEVKYRSDPDTIRKIQAEFGDFTSISMETAYYDTANGDLGKRWWTLRRRYENGRSVCTLKTPCPDGGRGEWEVESADIREALPLLCARGAPAELPELTAPGLRQVCAARFTRLAKTVSLEDCVLELALDQGVLLGGSLEEGLCEVEAELKAGSEAGCVAFARALARKFGLVPEKGSKYRRALALAQKDRQEKENV